MITFDTSTWIGLGQVTGVGLAALALVVGVVGYAVDRYRAAFRRRIIAEARTMVRLHERRRR